MALLPQLFLELDTLVLFALAQLQELVYPRGQGVVVLEEPRRFGRPSLFVLGKSLPLLLKGLALLLKESPHGRYLFG